MALEPYRNARSYRELNRCRWFGTQVPALAPSAEGDPAWPREGRPGFYLLTKKKPRP
jgi:hypothetical protein